MKGGKFTARESVATTGGGRFISVSLKHPQGNNDHPVTNNALLKHAPLNKCLGSSSF